jgi:hypothetical protein
MGSRGRRKRVRGQGSKKIVTVHGVTAPVLPQPTDLILSDPEAAYLRIVSKYSRPLRFSTRFDSSLGSQEAAPQDPLKICASIRELKA